MLYGSLTFVMLSAVCLIGEVAGAADCKALYEAVHQERVLMKKEALVKEALRVCPDDPDISYQNGYILERLRKYEEALAAYKKTIDLDPGYAKAYFSLGDIKASLKNYEEAAAAYREGLRHDPGDKRARSSLQEALAKFDESATPLTPVSQGKPLVPGDGGEEDRPKADIPQKAAKKAPQHAVAPIARLSIPFPEKTTELSQEARDVLSVVVGQAMNRDDMLDNRFEVGGHTDNRGAVGSNIEIAGKRAEAVKKYVTEGFGIDPKRLKTAAHGPKKPKVPNDSSENRGINNRVDFKNLNP